MPELKMWHNIVALNVRYVFQSRVLQVLQAWCKNQCLLKYCDVSVKQCHGHASGSISRR